MIQPKGIILSKFVLFAALFFCFSVVPNRVEAIQGVASGTVFYLPDTNGQVGNAYLELYWQIDPFSLHYRKDSNGALVAWVQTDIVISNDTGVLFEDSYLLATDPADPERASQRVIMDLRRLTLPYGKCKLELKLTEPEFPAQSFVYRQELDIPTPQSNHPLYSGIQLVDTLFLSPDVSNVFARNGYIQIPLAINFIDEDRKVLRYYSELYQTINLDTATFPIVQHSYISRREDGGMIPFLQKRDTMPAATVLPVIGTFDLSSLPSGNYFLNLRLIDRGGREVAAQNFFFQLLNKNPVSREDTAKKTEDTTDSPGVVFLDMSKTFVAKYNLAQVKAILEMLLPVADVWNRKAIENFLRRPDEMYMRYFIYNYFQKIDKDDPERAWKAFSERVKEVNRLYGTGSTPGYKTDRGQVYLKYGKPDDRVIVRNEQGALPYEIWHYYSVSQQSMEGLFLFYQPGSSVQDYRLLHSTVIGELRNTNWRLLLYTKGDGMINNSSRAEQYFRDR